ncbi:MAG: ribonuclease Z [Leadbetterella sp.]|nr:ribonuclease Z [Leadbetterella sp.]
MKLTILGTGSATPIVERRPSAALLDLGNESILIDCGEGTQFQMLKYKVRFSRLKYVLITHLHGDHYYGLIALINTLNNTGRTEPLILVGPQGLDEILGIQLRYSQAFLNYTLDFRCTNPDKPEEVYANEKISIRTFPLRHRIPCTGFLVAEKPAPRKILAEKLPADFPLPYFKMLKEGLDVTDELSGKTYLNSHYTADPEPPRQLAYCSDTIYDPALVEYVRNSHLMYHESTFTSELEGRAQITFHSTAAQAADIARRAGVRQLIIGHFSSRYKVLDNFLAEARAVFPDTLLAEEGRVYAVPSR